MSFQATRIFEGRKYVWEKEPIVTNEMSLIGNRIRQIDRLRPIVN